MNCQNVEVKNILCFGRKVHVHVLVHVKVHVLQQRQVHSYLDKKAPSSLLTYLRTVL